MRMVSIEIWLIRLSGINLIGYRQLFLSRIGSFIGSYSLIKFKQLDQGHAFPSKNFPKFWFKFLATITIIYALLIIPNIVIANCSVWEKTKIRGIQFNCLTVCFDCFFIFLIFECLVSFTLPLLSCFACLLCCLVIHYNVLIIQIISYIFITFSRIILQFSSLD